MSRIARLVVATLLAAPAAPAWAQVESPADIEPLAALVGYCQEVGWEADDFDVVESWNAVKATLALRASDALAYDAYVSQGAQIPLPADADTLERHDAECYVLSVDILEADEPPVRPSDVDRYYVSRGMACLGPYAAYREDCASTVMPAEDVRAPRDVAADPLMQVAFGGDRAAFERARPALEALAAYSPQVWRTTPSGTLLTWVLDQSSPEALRAAALHSPRAQALLGTALTLGSSGLEQDQAEGLRLLTLAAEGGDPIGLVNLAYRYENGIGVAQDYARSAELNRAAADQRHPVAQANLGLVYLNGRGSERDYPQAAHFFRLAAAQNNAMAQYYAGEMFAMGLGVPLDYDEAARLFQRAADQGLAHGLAGLGSLEVLASRGAADGFARALTLIAPGLQQNLPAAYRALGSMQYYGLGQPQDSREGIRNLGVASAQGDIQAINILASLYVNDILGDTALDIEVEGLLQDAARGGDPYVQKVLEAAGVDW